MLNQFHSSQAHLVPELLDHGIVGVLVGHVEGGVDGAAGRVLKIAMLKIHMRRGNMDTGQYPSR